MSDRLRRHLGYTRFMLIEESRLHAQMIGRVQFMLFPVMILFMAFVIGLSAKQLLNDIPMKHIYRALHSIMFVYGLGVGGFALFGERIAERRFGPVSTLLETPAIQPIDFRSMFLAFYLKDIIYYMLYTIVPLIGGLGLTIPITGFRVASVLLLFLTVSLSFLLGLSYSFLLSSIYARWRKAFWVIALVLVALLADSYLRGGDIASRLIPSIGFQESRDPAYLLESLVLIIAFSTVAVSTIKITFGKATSRYSDILLPTAKSFSFAKRYSTFLAKDWIDLIRSRSLTYISGVYLLPMVLLAVLLWFLERVIEIPLQFNTIFFASLMGFFGIEIYAWLNMLDTTSFYDTLPVKVSEVLKAKLLLFVILAGIISTAFLVPLSLMRSEGPMLGISLVVAYSTASYTVTATAYLTGLRTNSYLFDPRVLAKFAVAVIPPLLALSIISLHYAKNWLASVPELAFVCAMLAAATYIFAKGISRKWDKETFGY